jgi:hypothetical protein
MDAVGTGNIGVASAGYIVRSRRLLIALRLLDTRVVRGLIMVKPKHPLGPKTIYVGRFDQ